MNVSSLIIIAGLMSIVIYFISKFNWKLGTALQTITFLVFGYFLYSTHGDSQSVLKIFNGVNLRFAISDFNYLFLLIGVSVMFIVSIFSIDGIKKFKFKPAYNFLITLIFVSILGVFGAADFIALFIFWELLTWAAFFIVSMGKKFSRKAALLFLFMSMISAYFLITGIITINNTIGSFTFEALINNYDLLTYSIKIKILIFFLIAGLIKSGIYPFHIWVRTTHGESPHTFSPVLSGLLLKFGFYIIYLISIFFPISYIISSNPAKLISEIPGSTFFAYLGGISIIVGTISAILQNDAKKLIAFSSVSHGGYILLAFSFGTSLAFAGGLAHIIVHALTALGMFLSIGAVYYRTGTTKIDEMGGLIKNMPVTFTTYLVSIISLAGIPPLVGFVSKWLIYQSLIVRGSYFLAFAAFFGSIGSFMYVFRPLAGVFLGQRPKRFENVKEVPVFMQVSMLIVTLLTVLFGVLPGLILKPIAYMQQQIGIKPIKASLYKLFTELTTLDMVIVFSVFSAGFIVALIVFMLFAKPTKVKQHEQYTAGEIVPELQTQPSIYHYAKNYYKPFARIFEKFPSLENWYRKCANYLSNIFEIFEEFFYKESINGYIWLITLTFLIVLFIRWF